MLGNWTEPVGGILNQTKLSGVSPRTLERNGLLRRAGGDLARRSQWERLFWCHTGTRWNLRKKSRLSVHSLQELYNLGTGLPPA